MDFRHKSSKLENVGSSPITPAINAAALADAIRYLKDRGFIFIDNPPKPAVSDATHYICYKEGLIVLLKAVQLEVVIFTNDKEFGPFKIPSAEFTKTLKFNV